MCMPSCVFCLELDLIKSQCFSSSNPPTHDYFIMIECSTLLSPTSSAAVLCSLIGTSWASLPRPPLPTLLYFSPLVPTTPPQGGIVLLPTYFHPSVRTGAVLSHLSHLFPAPVTPHHRSLHRYWFGVHVCVSHCHNRINSKEGRNMLGNITSSHYCWIVYIYMHIRAF